MSRVLGSLLRRQASSGTRIIAASSWISDTLPFGRLLVRRAERNQQCHQLCQFNSGSHDAVIRVYDEAGNVVETHEQAGWIPEKRLPHQSIA